MIPWAVQTFLGIYLTAEENPGKPQLGDGRRSLCDQSSSKMDSHWALFPLRIFTQGKR